MAAARGKVDTPASVERELSAALVATAPELREILIDGFARMLQHAIATERTRCAELCRARAALWRTPTHEAMRGQTEVRRARVNEAEYLADAIETPSDLLP
jgi:hypothetical protein